MLGPYVNGLSEGCAQYSQYFIPLNILNWDNVKSFENKINLKIENLIYSIGRSSEVINLYIKWSEQLRINFSSRSLEWAFRLSDWFFVGIKLAIGQSTKTDHALDSQACGWLSDCPVRATDNAFTAPTIIKRLVSDNSGI